MTNEKETNLNGVRNRIGDMMRELGKIGQYDIAMRLGDEMNNITRITNL